MLKKFFAIFLALTIPFPVNADYVSNPSNIPLFDNYSTPVIKPSESSFFSFTIQNRYSKNMENVSLILEIYKYATIKVSKNIKEISNAPKFVEDKENIITSVKNQTAEATFLIIPPNATKEIRVKISSEKETPQGTYIIRAMIKFDYENNNYVMKSIGHFSKEQWENITNTPETDTNRINDTYLNSLGVKAIIPESSFSVKEPFPIWVLYVLIGVASFFLVMAIVFYIRDEGKRK